MARHIRVVEAMGEIRPFTETGRFHIVLLHLNRPALVAYRVRQRFHELLRERRELVEAENNELRALSRPKRNTSHTSNAGSRARKAANSRY